MPQPTNPDLTIIPMTGGVMLDTGPISDPAELDLSTITDLHAHYGAVLISGLKMDPQRIVDLTNRLSVDFTENVGGTDNDRSSDLTEDVERQPGDVAIVDNLRVMYGRRTYQDASRNIIMRLSQAPISA